MHFPRESFIRFKNNITYYTIHPANMAQGGSTIIIRYNIKHIEEEKYVTRDIQATNVTIDASKPRHTVSEIYCPPRYNIYANEYKTYLTK
jgi:hypothetical protein